MGINALNRPSLFFSPKQRESITELIFQAILNDDGRVRHAAVQLGEKVRILPPGLGNREKMMEGLVPYIERTLALLREYAPRSWYKYTSPANPLMEPELKPSKAKSLLLLWHALAEFGVYSEEFLTKYPSCALPFYVQWYERHEHGGEGDDRTIDEIARGIWHRGAPDHDTKQALAELESHARERFSAELETVGKSPADLDAYLDHGAPADTKQDQCKQFLTDLATQALESGSSLDALSSIVRGLQGYMNAMRTAGENGDPFIPALAIARENLPKSRSAHLHELPAALLAVHRAADAFLDHRKQEYAEVFNKLRTLDSVAPESNEHTAIFERIEECRSIVHHVIDWYFQLIPGHFLTRSTEASAAIALDIVDQFNNEPPLARSIPYDRAQLTELGGWRSSIRQASLTAYSDIAVSVRDRQLVILTADPSIGEEPYDALAESG